MDNPTTGGAVAVQMGYAVFSRHSEAEKARRNLDDMPFFGTNPRYEWAVDQPPPEKARHSPPRSKSGGGSRAAHSRNRGIHFLFITG